MFLRTPTAFVFVRHVAETAEDTSEGQCVYILKTPRPASLRLAGRSCLRQLVSLEKAITRNWGIQNQNYGWENHSDSPDLDLPVWNFRFSLYIYFDKGIKKEK